MITYYFPITKSCQRRSLRYAVATLKFELFTRVCPHLFLIRTTLFYASKLPYRRKIRRGKSDEMFGQVTKLFADEYGEVTKFYQQKIFPDE